MRLVHTAALILFGVVLALQWRAASMMLGGDLTGDEPKHFTSGVLVYDYLRTGLGSNPMRFAEDFEARYPRVAIGHWPPMYYAVQAAFYFLAGPSIQSAQVLSALTAAALAALIFLSVRRFSGWRIALILAFAFLALPLIQIAAWQVMSDLLTGLFVYLAILAFVRLLDDQSDWKAAVGFAVCAVSAILTKGSAWALGPFFVLAPWLCRRKRFFLSRWFFGALALVILAGSSFYILAARTGIGYPTRLSHYLTVGLLHRLGILLDVLGFAPAVLLGMSVVGAGVALQARWWLGDESRGTTLSLAAAAWMISQLVFLLVLPMTPESRVLLPSLAPAAVLAAQFLMWFGGVLRIRAEWLPAIPVLLVGLLVADCGRVPLERVDGYRQAADAMPYSKDGTVILLAVEDWRAEGALITDRLSQDPRHKDVILRGTHMLNTMQVKGVYQPVMHSADEVRNYLLAMPVRFVVLDQPPFDDAYQYLVDSAVVGDPADFRLLARVPIKNETGRKLDELRIYENMKAGGRHPSEIGIPLGFDGAKRVIEFHWP